MLYYFSHISAKTFHPEGANFSFNRYKNIQICHLTDNYYNNGTMGQYEPHLSKYPNHVTEHVVHGHTTVWGGRDHQDSLVSLTHLECVDHVWVSLELALHGWNRIKVLKVCHVTAKQTKSKYRKYVMSQGTHRITILKLCHMSQGNTENQSTESMSCLRETHRIKVLKICHVSGKHTESKYCMSCQSLGAVVMILS